ncbi:MAG TPA: ATP-binding protein [Anaerolineaceae bacterium]
MRCRTCHTKAVINMRHHRLSLCKDHYLDWFVEQTGKTIKKYHMFGHSQRVLVAVSGGKDSLSLWDVLWRLGYNADGLYINLGIGADGEGGLPYSDLSAEHASRFASERGLKLLQVNIRQEYGETIPEIAARTRHGGDRPCSVCGLVKRHVMNRVAAQGGYAVLTTAHNLDDEAAVLFSNALTWSSELLRRQAPVLEEGEGLTRKAKPFCRVYERESAAYAILRGIPYIHDECPYAEGSTTLYYKEILNQLETKRPSSKLTYYTTFLKAKDEGLFTPEPPEEHKALHPCPSCGQLTSAAERCAFCRLVPGLKPGASPDQATSR